MVGLSCQTEDNEEEVQETTDTVNPRTKAEAKLSSVMTAVTGVPWSRLA